MPSPWSASKVSSVTGSSTSSFKTNHFAKSCPTRRYEITIGLYSISEALTFSTHAISSSALSRMASAPRSASSPRSHSIFSSRDSPAWMRNIEVCGIPGLSSHITFSKSGTPTNVKPLSRSSSAAAALVQSESTAITAPSPSWLRSHSGISTCSGTRVLCRTQPVPSSCSTA